MTHSCRSLRKLGIIANYMPNYSLKPWIDTVAEGLVQDWNKARKRWRLIRENEKSARVASLFSIHVFIGW